MQLLQFFFEDGSNNNVMYGSRTVLDSKKEKVSGEISDTFSYFNISSIVSRLMERPPKFSAVTEKSLKMMPAEGSEIHQVTKCLWKTH